MREIIISDKQAYLTQNSISEDFKLTDKRNCLHCHQDIIVGEYKVYKSDKDGFEFICCPNAPECNGTMIDWMPIGLFD